MIGLEQRTEMRRLYYAEHWTAGTIASALGVHRDGDLVGHGAAGHEHARLEPEQAGGLGLQGVDAGVFAVDVIADRGLEHGGVHGWGGFGHGVAAQVDAHAWILAWVLLGRARVDVSGELGRRSNLEGRVVWKTGHWIDEGTLKVSSRIRVQNETREKIPFWSNFAPL